MTSINISFVTPVSVFSSQNFKLKYFFSYSQGLDGIINQSKTFECPRQRTESLWHPPPTDDYKGHIDESISFKFEDPKTYKGPVVPGWEPGKVF